MTPQEALALVRSRGVLPFADFVAAVVGAPVKGSWWGHPKGHEIFNLAGHAGRECIFAKLVGGKETFVHRTRLPALARRVTDEAWRKERIAKLSKEAKALLREVEKKGRVRTSKAIAKPRLELQRALLVHSDEEHTETGNHVAVLVAWKDFLDPEVRRAAAKLSPDEAKVALDLGGGAPAPRRSRRASPRPSRRK